MRIKEALIAAGIGGLLLGAGAGTAKAGSPPVNPTIYYNQLSSGSITVIWGLPGATSGYIVNASTTSAGAAPLISSITFNSNISTLTVSGLTPNTTYFMNAGALYWNTTNYALTSPNAVVTLTNPLQGFHLIQVTSSSIAANWTSMVASSATGYRMEASTSSNFSSNIFSTFTFNLGVTTLAVTGLQTGTTFYVRAGALNWANQPNFVLFGSTTTLIAFSGPPPGNPNFVQISSDSMTVSWGPPGATNGYIVEASSYGVGATPWSFATTFNSNQSTLTVTGLIPNTTYYLQVGALYAGTTSYTATVPPVTVSLSSPLTAIQVVQVSSDSLTLNWASMAASSATGYRLDVSTNSVFTNPVFSSMTFDVNSTTLSVGGLIPGTSYFIRVGAFNRVGVPNFSLIGSTKTLIGSSGPPPVNPTIIQVTTGAITMTWNPPGATAGYILEGSTVSNFSPVWSSSVTLDPSVTSLTVFALTFNTTHYLRVGALYAGGTTSYTVLTSTVVTLAGQVVSLQVLQTSSNTIQAAWINTFGGSGSAGYLMDASTSSNFTGAIISSSTFDANSTTLTVSGLLTGATYYVRVGNMNWSHLPNFALAISTITQGASAPAGLAGTGLGISSINWTWGTVSGASVYNLYLATAPSMLVYSGATNSFIETNLSTNTAYGRVVSAVVSVEGSLSPSVTGYTLAATPGMPSFSAVGTSSMTVTWNTQGNPGSTLYEVTRSTIANFSTLVSTPILFGSNFITNTTTFINLTPATTYYVRVRAMNGNALITSFSPINVVMTLIPVSGGGGVGTATIQPTTVQEGGVVTTTVTFTIPSVGMAPGGKIEVTMPQGWGPAPQFSSPGQNGYVQALSTAAATFNLSISSGQSVQVSLVSGFLAGGTKIQVAFQNIFINCPPVGQNQAVWGVKSAMGSGSSLSTIAGVPIQTLTTGTARWLSYVPWNSLTVAANQPSQALVLQASDNCGQGTILASPLTVTLDGLLPDSITADPNAQFSANANLVPPTNTVVIPAASSSTVFYYLTTSTGTNLWFRGSYFSPFDGNPQAVWRSVNVLAGAFTFGSVSVDSGTPVNGQTSYTITPDGDNVNDLAYIHFNPSDPALQWHVQISSDGFQDFVYDRWGYGNPYSSLLWDGRDFRNGSIVANGTYNIKIDAQGLATNTASSITINTAQISGSVTLGPNPIAGAWVNAQSTSGSGYSMAQTDANGNYVMNGLRSGVAYNLYTSFYNFTTQTQLNSQLTNVTAPASGKNFALSSPGVLRISAVAPSTASVNVYGSINVFTTNYTQNFWGNIRLLSGTTTSDNGDSFNPSTWTILGVPPGSYMVHLNMQGYGATDQPITIAANQTLDLTFPLVGRATIFGKISLPAPVTNNTWISVQGSLLTNNYPTVFGGASFNVGDSTGIYTIYAVNAGTYTFSAQVPGYAPKTVTPVIVNGLDIGDPVNGGLDFNITQIGGKISGSIIINGDTTAQPNPMSLWVSAFSPQLGQNAFTQVSMPTDPLVTQSTYSIGGLADGTYQIYSPFLPGFNSATFGPQSVVVSGGAGSLTMVLNQNTGKIGGTIKLPGVSVDYDQVHLSLQGPISQEINLPNNSTYTLTGLASGNYTLIATYLTSGTQVKTFTSVVNGLLQTVNLDLSPTTYSISGTVSVLSGFSMADPTGSAVTVNTVTDLLADATQQTITLGGVPTNTPTTGFQCTGGSATIVSTARVEAFPKNFNSFDQANRSGFNNCFGVGQYKYNPIAADGSYTISGLSPGLWEVDVYPYFDNGSSPNVAVSKQTVSVINSPVSGINFALASGNAASGTLNLPSGVTDVRTFNAQVVSSRGDSIQTITIQLGTPGTPAASASFTLSHIPAGNYSLVIQDPGTIDSVLQRNVVKYVAQPYQFQSTGGDLTGINVTLSNASRIVGKLAIQGADSAGNTNLTLITANNETLLPDNFSIFAQANPWVPSGFAQANRQPMGPKVYIDGNNQFSIDGLIAGTYDVTFRQEFFGASLLGQGSIDMASYTQGAVVVPQGQTLDLGTITLKPGLSLSGIVTDVSGVTLANIRVRARPSNSQNGSDTIDVFTDGNGKFTFSGLNPTVKTYDFIAAPRPYSGEDILPSAYSPASRQAVDVTQVPTPTLNFKLSAALASLTGKVITVDSNPLSYPNGDQNGYPAAAIFVKLQGTNDADNPLGNDNATALDGRFNITNLGPGTYDITVESLGYRPLKLTGVALTNTVKDLGTLTLQIGPSLTVTLAKPDGSAVNTSDVHQAVAASADLSSIIFGQTNSDAQTNNILSIKFGGFELTPKTYSILLFDSRNNIIVPADGKGLVFTANADSVSRALTFQPTAPQAITNIQKASNGTDVLITYYFSRPLRNGLADQDPTQWLTLSSGHGALTGITLSGDRRQLKLAYTPAASEDTATLQFSASTVDIDPSTNVEFTITKSLTLLLGQRATAEQTINLAIGGEVSLSDAQDTSKITIPPNAFVNRDGTTADATTSYALTFSATDDAATAGASVLAGAPRVAKLMQRSPAAYLSESYAAMKSAKAAANINPLSSFYSILLPTGLSHTLNQNSTLTLNYDTDADPSLINVYFFNRTEYLIEQNSRVVDTANHTISVGVSHFSTFVVLENNQPVVQVNGDVSSGSDIEVFNFPNPFDLQSKTKTLNHGGTTSTLTTEGTIIRYSIPAALLGPAKIVIYNIIGEKVRTLDLGTPLADTFNYVAWDGRNEAGKSVASGVYVGELKSAGSKKFFKMAVIK